MMGAIVSISLAQEKSVLTVGSPLLHTVEGLGVEFDPHFLTQNVPAANGTKETDWDEVILPRLRRLRPAKMRVMVLPEWYEPTNDNSSPEETNLSAFHFESPEMKGLYRLLDFAEEEGIGVTLTFWGTRSGTFLLPEQWPGWMMGPSEYDEWAENLSVCLRHLLDTKQYSCIREVTPVNEPDWSFSTNQHNQATLYAAMCHTLDARLRRDGLRERFRMSLSDNSDGGSGTHRFLKACTETLAHEADIFNSHTYIFGYETPNSRMLEWERENVRLSEKAKKRHFIGEFGSNQTVGATIQRDIDRYERGILMARIVINMLNAGASGASYWSLLDQYYSRGEAQARSNMQRLGLWRYLRQEYASDSIYQHLREDYQPRPQYYALGLLYRFIQPGSTVYPVDTHSEWVAATALRTAEGKWRYVMANPTEMEIAIRLENPQAKGRARLTTYLYAENCLPEDDSLPNASGRVRSRGGKLDITLPSRSVIVLAE